MQQLNRCASLHLQRPLLVLWITAISIVACHRNLHCQDRWDGPSADHTLSSCKPERIAYESDVAAGLLIPIIVGGLILLAGIAFLIAKCCCGCCPRTSAGKGIYRSTFRIRAAKLLTLLVFLIGCIGMIFIVAGYSQTKVGYNKLWEATDDLFTWAEEQRNYVRNQLTDPNTGLLIPPVQESYFIEFQDTIDARKRDVNRYHHDANTQFMNLYTGLSLGIGIGALAILLVNIVYALCNIRHCAPLVSIILHFLFAILFCALTSFFAGSIVAGDVACGEMDRYQANQSGLVLWWLEPRCDQNSPFDNIKEGVLEAERNNSIAACQTFQFLCSPSPTYDLTNPFAILVCDVSDPFAQCSTLDAASNIILNATLKTNLPSLCSSVDNNQCTISKCAEDCTIDTLKQYANETKTYLDDAQRALNAYNTSVLPLLSCHTIMEKAVGYYNGCSNVNAGVGLQLAGSAVYVVAFLLGIVALYKGQTLFVSSSSRSASRTPDHLSGTPSHEAPGGYHPPSDGGDWRWDEHSGYFWSDTHQRYYDPLTGLYFQSR